MRQKGLVLKKTTDWSINIWTDMLCMEDGLTSMRQIARDNLKTAQTSQCASVGTLTKLHEEALRRY